jgi:hypothetical protein
VSVLLESHRFKYGTTVFSWSYGNWLEDGWWIEPRHILTQSWVLVLSVVVLFFGVIRFGVSSLGIIDVSFISVSVMSVSVEC